jgi:hypothetical protein
MEIIQSTAITTAQNNNLGQEQLLTQLNFQVANNAAMKIH